MRRARLLALALALVVGAPEQSWQAEDYLYRLAGVQPPDLPPGGDAAARDKRRAAWAAWWRTHGARVNLVKPEVTAGLLGHTLVVEWDEERRSSPTTAQAPTCGPAASCPAARSCWSRPRATASGWTPPGGS
jgi:hypothetical protein